MKLTLSLPQVLDYIKCAGFFSTSKKGEKTIVSGGSNPLN